MTFLQYHARPHDEPVNPEDIAGAYINCWINDNNQREAKRKAIKMMKENGWSNFTLEEVSIVNRSDYENKEEQLQYFDQAIIDDEVFVVHTYPLAGRDGE